MGDDFEIWKNHFIDQARGRIPFHRKFYKVSNQGGHGTRVSGDPSIKMVTPTEQVVERAKTTLSDPPSIYDPVTGVMQHSEGDHTGVRTSCRQRHAKYSSSSKKKKKTVKKENRITKKKSTTKSKKTKKQQNGNVKWWQ